MSDIWWVLPTLSTTSDTSTKHNCMARGIMCEYATINGYCGITVCLKMWSKREAKEYNLKK